MVPPATQTQGSDRTGLVNATPQGRYTECGIYPAKSQANHRTRTSCWTIYRLKATAVALKATNTSEEG